jgi:hypothetical protein
VPTPVIFIPREPEQLTAAHDFHLKSVGEFLLPRTIEQFDALAQAGELWVAVVEDDVVGSCYVTRGDDEPDAEFGGIIIRDDWKGTGFASAIGTVAIAAHFLHDPSPLIAHVHLDNQDPLPLLTGRLGFTKLEGKPAELNKAELEKTLGKPINMRADANGIIRGNTFGFSPKWLAELADRLASNQLAKVPVQVANKYFEQAALTETVRTLRDLAAKV